MSLYGKSIELDELQLILAILKKIIAKII